MKNHKRDYLNFPIVNCLFLCNKIPAALVYGVYIPSLSDITEVVVPIMISVIADRVSAIKEAADPRVPAG